MAKKKPAAGKLAGKRVALLGKFGYGKYDLDRLKRVATSEGAKIVDGDKTAADYLVAGAGVGGNPPASVAKIQKKHPQTQVLDQAGFYSLVNPTPEEFRELMLRAKPDWRFWYEMQERVRLSNNPIDLRGSDFRNKAVSGAFEGANLDGSDFRGARISAQFGPIRGVKFDGAVFNEGDFSQAEDCSLKKVSMHCTRWNPARFTRCDFSGSTLEITVGGYTVTRDCRFAKANFTQGDLDESQFPGADFSGASLKGARLQKTDFTGANLSGADLTGADLRQVKFTNANLQKAKLCGAVLSGADLTGATIDDADFTDANVTGATLTGLDLSKAKNLTEREVRKAGPYIRQLAKVAMASKKLTTYLELDLGKGNKVLLYPSVWSYGSRIYPGARYRLTSKSGSRDTYVDAQSFEKGMLNLTDLFSGGTPKFDTVTAKASKCPLKPKDLKDLCIAAWHEACGLEVPEPDDRQKAAQQQAKSDAGLRKTLLAELAGGAAGVKKFNARSDQERAKLGRLHKSSFAGAELKGVDLSSQNLEACNLEGANLEGAKFGKAQLRKSSFANANLGGAYFASCKPTEASFAGATLTGCNLRNAKFLRCDFQNANLAGADFSYADLGGADFRGATLTKVTFFRTNFDEKTRFPSGFQLEDTLVWKGSGPRPGTPPPKPAKKAGSLSFEEFLKLLNANVEAARMEKAGQMLKAEKFQLFADVKDDALMGVVKSQTSADLVYSCRLASNGAFSCCTQNLRPCGGLRGALCKHLLVLIVGLAKAGQLDSATVDHWIALSKRQKPAIDEDLMSATFLRYKGAESGEIDWRPTETIPEDFYAM